MRGQVGLFLGCYLFARRNLYHVAVLAHIQAAALQDDIERLIPRHILQAQGKSPFTVSLMTMFNPVKSAITFNASRTSIFWKFSVSFSPV